MQTIIESFLDAIIQPMAKLIADGLTENGKDVSEAEVLAILDRSTPGPEGPVKRRAKGALSGREAAGAAKESVTSVSQKITRAKIPSGARGAAHTCTYVLTRAKGDSKKKGDLCGEPCDESGLCKTHKSSAKSKENKLQGEGAKVTPPPKSKIEIKNLQTRKFIPQPATAEEKEEEAEEEMSGPRKPQPIKGTPTGWSGIKRTADGYLYHQNSAGDVVVYCTGELDGMRAHLEEPHDRKALQLRGWKMASKVVRDKAVQEGIFEVASIGPAQPGVSTEQPPKTAEINDPTKRGRLLVRVQPKVAGKVSVPVNRIGACADPSGRDREAIPVNKAKSESSEAEAESSE